MNIQLLLQDQSQGQLHEIVPPWHQLARSANDICNAMMPPMYIRLTNNMLNAVVVVVKLGAIFTSWLIKVTRIDDCMKKKCQFDEQPSAILTLSASLEANHAVTS